MFFYECKSFTNFQIADHDFVQMVKRPAVGT